MRIGIYGGSFNPIHRGHVSLARDICQAGLVDQIWLMVSPLNPLKQDQQSDLLHHSLRFQMAELALAEEPQLFASDFEMQLPLPSYTINTLHSLREAYPQHEFVLIVGEDNWERFHQWYRADEIKRDYDIIVYGRRDNKAGDKVDAQETKVQVYPHGKRKRTLHRKFLLYPISSTDIRHALKDNNISFVSDWLHPAVLQFILDHHLYGASFQP